MDSIFIYKKLKLAELLISESQSQEMHHTPQKIRTVFILI